jgi:hypothetical protein
MKLMGVALATIIALFAFDGLPAAAAELDGAGTVAHKGAVSLRVKRHRYVRVDQRRHVYAGPQACDAVIFPRSPLCASHDFFGWPSAPFWNIGGTRYGP